MSDCGNQIFLQIHIISAIIRFANKILLWKKKIGKTIYVHFRPTRASNLIDTSRFPKICVSALYIGFVLAFEHK